MQYKQKPQKTLTGARLRSYAYALLTRREYSKAELTNKLLEYAQDDQEAIDFIQQLHEYGYQSDQRAAEQVLRSHLYKGQGPHRIKQKLQQSSLDTSYIDEQIQETDWFTEAYNLKIRKFGDNVEKDPKKRAKQIRFLQYRGYDLDIIFKVVDFSEDY